MPHILLQSAPREYTRTSAIFRVELQGDFQLGQIPLVCTITHRCEVKNQQSAVVIPKDTPSVFTLQGNIARETEQLVVSGGQGNAYTYDKYHYYFQPLQPLQLIPPQGLPQLPLTIPITLEFICRGRRTHTAPFTVPINSGWFGEIQVALGNRPNRIESRAIPFAER